MAQKVEVEHPDKKVATGAYSAGVVMDGWLYISGQGPVDMATGQPIPGTIEEQTRLTLSHIDKVLQAAGCPRENVVKCTAYLADIGDFDRYNKVYGEFFTGTRPARTTIACQLWGGIKVEIDAIAKMP